MDQVQYQTNHRLHLKPLWIFLGSTLLFFTIMIITASSVSAHGYIESPASRGYKCKLGENVNCGRIIYEPHSLEGKGNFPIGGPADGQITGAGIFTELYEQTPTRWSKVNMNGGPNTFKWVLTAAHATSDWKYYITKKGWDSSKPLARADLELFCTFNDGGKQPPNTVTHTCNVPTDRTGYYLILAVWEIADTGNAFYNVIDVNLNNGSGNQDTQAPTVPANLRTTGVTSSSISLAWNASTDNVGVTGYEIYRGSNLVATVSGSTLSHTVTGLQAGTSYTFTVKARDGAGNESQASNPLTVSTSNPVPDTQAPTAPAHLRSAGSTSTSVSLAWNGSTDNVGVSGYEVYRGTTLVTTVSGSTLSYTVSGLSPNTTYSFTVKARDAAGNVSPASNELQVTTADGSVPETPAWAPNTSYQQGALVTYGGKTYECRQAHTSLPGWEPANVPALWLLKS